VLPTRSDGDTTSRSSASIARGRSRLGDPSDHGPR
jgi:hypothetical protein